MSEHIKALITLAQLGDEKSVEELWEAFRPLRYKWARSTILPSWEWEDFQQEAYILLIQAIHQYDAELGMSFEGYYKVTLYNWRYKKLRKRKEYLGVLADITEQDEYQQPIDKEDIADNIHLKVQCERMLELLEDLDSRDREILTRHYFHYETLKDIGASLGLKDRTTYSRVNRLLQKLRKNF